MPVFSFRKSKEQLFWKWFVGHLDHFNNFSENVEENLDLLSSELQKLHADLVPEVGHTNMEDDINDFVISANGIKEAFPFVEKLVKLAPSIPGWKVTAFRQRTSAYITYEGIQFDRSNVWFKLVANNGSPATVGITLYFSAIDGTATDLAGVVSYILLDAALGEVDVVTKVGYVLREIISSSDITHDMKSIDELPETFDELYKAINS